MITKNMSSRQERGQVTLQNRLPPKHPQRLALQSAIRDTLAGLAGSWDVVLDAPEGLSLVVTVVAHDGSAWVMSCCNPAHGDPESIAAWAKDPEHQVAKRKGREIWYSHYMIRICKVEREYGRPDW